MHINYTVCHVLDGRNRGRKKKKEGSVGGVKGEKGRTLKRRNGRGSARRGDARERRADAEMMESEGER